MNNERNNIFQIMESNESLLVNSKRILKLYTREATVETLDFSVLTIEEFMAQQFIYWKGKNNAISLNDFYISTDFDVAVEYINSCKKASDVEVSDSFLIIAESILNFINYLFVCRLDQISNNQSPRNIECWAMLKNILNNTLQKYNYVFRFDKNKQTGTIGVFKPAIEHLINRTPDNLIELIVKYNHYKIKGNIGEKKLILKEIGDYFEGERKRLQISKKTSNMIFSFLNNLNIRHNNVNPDDSLHFCKATALMSNSQLEESYDNLYDLMIYALTINDYNNKKQAIEELYNKLN